MTSAGLASNFSSNKVGQSKSLWNYALSPGWSPQEVEILKIAVMKFGVGSWTKLFKSNVLPGKFIQQCYLQVQRIFGQQSLVGFMGLHVDIDAIYEDNKKKTGARKQGFLVNDGDKLTKEKKVELKKDMQAKYGLDMEYVDHILKLPPSSKVKIYDIDKIVNSRKKMSTGEKIDHLLELKKTLITRLGIVQTGRKLVGFHIETYKEWKLRTSQLKSEGIMLIKSMNEEEVSRNSSNVIDNNQIDPEKSQIASKISKKTEKKLKASVTCGKIKKEITKQTSDSDQRDSSLRVSNYSTGKKRGRPRKDSINQSQFTFEVKHKVTSSTRKPAAVDPNRKVQKTGQMIEITDSTHSKGQISPLADSPTISQEEKKSDSEKDVENIMAQEVENLLAETEWDSPSKQKRKRDKKSTPAVKPAIADDSCSGGTISMSKMVAASKFSSDSTPLKMQATNSTSPSSSKKSQSKKKKYEDLGQKQISQLFEKQK